MPRYVTQLGESFCCPSLIFFKNGNFLGHTKTFGALAKEWLMKCKTSFLPPNENNSSLYFAKKALIF